MGKPERAAKIKQLETSPTLSDSVKANRLAKLLPRMVKPMRRQIAQANKVFANITGEDTAAKQTAVFDAISGNSDGDLILHDLGQFFDTAITLANDYRQPDEDALTAPFTDADVDAYFA